MRAGVTDCRMGVAAVLAVALCVVAPVADARDKPGTEVQAPYFGEVLFHFYQQDDFTALTHLLAARSTGRVDAHKAEAELLLGGLYLGYGQHREAGRIFNLLLDSHPSPAVKDRAWFYLGKVRFQRGLYDQALQALNEVGDELPKNLAAEYYLLLAQSHMGLGDYAQAAAVLNDHRAPDDWLAYGRYNLGVALIRMGELESGSAALQRVGQLSTRAPELRSLRDKANLALGYAQLQAGQPATARETLLRVRLRGPFSNKALLGVGWADALQSNYQTALAPWLELRDRDLLDGAVQESLLAVPFAFGKLDAHGSAVDHYLDALAAFDGEMQRLDDAIGRARSGELVPALLREDDPDIGRWYWQLQNVADNDDARYLYHLMANHDFQDGLRNYRDLNALLGHLNDWEAKLAAFDDMLDTREQAYAQRLPEFDQRMQAADLEGIRARRDAAAARLAAAEQTHDVAALADADQRWQWEMLQSLESAPGFAAADADARERHRVLKGFLQWQLDSQHNYRLWEQGRALQALDEALLLAEERAARTAAAREKVPAEVKAYRQRIAALVPRLAGKKERLYAALGGQQSRLQILAVSELEDQKDRLATYRVQARFALATIYDRANATTAERGDTP